MIEQRLIDRIVKHEGLRLKPYHDSLGFVTIGIGRNLDNKGISKDEAYDLLDNDISDCIGNLSRNIPWWKALDDLRQEVLIEMCFQLGIGGLLKFREFLYQLESGNSIEAAKEMRDSVWYKQTPQRAEELAKMIEG